jgi:hypothetical protein
MPLIRIVESKDLSVTSLRAKDYIKPGRIVHLEDVRRRNLEKKFKKEAPSGKPRQRPGLASV